MSKERRKLLRALGADLVLTPADGGMAGAIEEAEAVAAEREPSFVPQQFTNLANPRIHRETTGPEIWAATDGDVDTVVAGVGTGGTITGVSEFLTEELEADVRTIAVEPAESAVLSGEDAGSHSIQGSAPGSSPDPADRKPLDEVPHRRTRGGRRDRASPRHRGGLLAGVSSGAALAVAERVATDAPDDTVVVILPDTGERYLSTDLFAWGGRHPKPTGSRPEHVRQRGL